VVRQSDLDDRFSLIHSDFLLTSSFVAIRTAPVVFGDNAFHYGIFMRSVHHGESAVKNGLFATDTTTLTILAKNAHFSLEIYSDFVLLFQAKGKSGCRETQWGCRERTGDGS
jgi:hypothetical protein